MQNQKTSQAFNQFPNVMPSKMLLLGNQSCIREQSISESFGLFGEIKIITSQQGGAYSDNGFEFNLFHFQNLNQTTPFPLNFSFKSSSFAIFGNGEPTRIGTPPESGLIVRVIDGRDRGTPALAGELAVRGPGAPRLAESDIPRTRDDASVPESGPARRPLLSESGTEPGNYLSESHNNNGGQIDSAAFLF